MDRIIVEDLLFNKKYMYVYTYVILFGGEPVIAKAKIKLVEVVVNVAMMKNFEETRISDSFFCFQFQFNSLKNKQV